MNPNQKKHTVLSIVFASLAIICAIICILIVSGTDFPGMEDNVDTSENPIAGIIGFIIVGFAYVILNCLIMLCGAFAIGGFALASYKNAEKAIKAETGDKKFVLPRIFRIISAIELTAAALVILCIVGIFIYVMFL